MREGYPWITIIIVLLAFLISVMVYACLIAGAEEDEQMELIREEAEKRKAEDWRYEE